MRLMRAVKLNIKAEDCKFKNNELEAGGNCRAGDHSLQVQGWLHMHNLITMLVLFLEHHDKYCSRTIIETFEMSHFCKTRKKARKNMNMGEVILLTSKYDSPARQPKKTVMATPLSPWWMPYAWHIQSQQLALHVDMWSKGYPTEALMWTLSSNGCRDGYAHAWFCLNSSWCCSPTGLPYWTICVVMLFLVIFVFYSCWIAKPLL